MKASELIATLHSLIEEHGDLEVLAGSRESEDIYEVAAYQRQYYNVAGFEKYDNLAIWID